MSDVIYNRTVFKQFFEKNDNRVMAWADNVLSKVCNPGILPTFFDKTNPDFVSFWGGVTHLFALIVIYGRQYEEIDVNKILFDLFISERGLVTDTVTTEEQMEYLFNNYVEEYRKRGRMDIVSKEGSILGELLRLIRYSDPNEFIFSLLSPKEIGWTIGWSSPTWRRTDTVLNITKAYESTVNVEDLSKYPLINATGVRLQSDVDNDNNPIQTMTFVGATKVGISSENDLDTLLVVDEDVDYQISFKLKANATQDLGLTFGILAYDELKRPMTCVETVGTTESNHFTPNGAISLVNPDVYYDIRVILFKKNRAFVEEVGLNFLNGTALKLVKGVKYISLYLVQDRSASSANLNIYDIKVKPLYLPFYQGYLGEKNVIASYYRNASYSSQSTIDQFIDTYLVSYKNIFVGSEIKSLDTTTKVRFKVFSERRAYVEGATITIAGETLTTDVNGEATIDLYPGDYLYSVDKELFVSVDQEVLTVEEGTEEQICYIQLTGEIYERTITFVVRDENNRPLSGATVTFNNETQTTGQDGMVAFKAFPSLVPYVYKVVKEGYYNIDHSILVQDNMIENVEMELIPLFDVTFAVKDTAGNPIVGARVTFNNKFVDTDSQGNATFIDVLSGTYSYRIEKVDWLPETGSITIEDDDVTQDIVMEPVPTYEVTFVTRSVSYQGAVAILTGTTIAFAGSTKQTDSEGKASFVVKAGSYPITATKNEYETYSSTVEVTEEEEIEIRLQQKVYTVTFNVHNISNQGLGGVTIVVDNNPSITTDSKGKATIELPTGSFNYSASLAEYHTVNDTFAVNGGPEEVDVLLAQQMYLVTITVREDGEISVGADVSITPSGFNAKTNDQGQVQTELPNGTYTYTIEKEHYQTVTDSFVVNSGPNAFPVNLVRKNGTVNFYVYDEDVSQNTPVSSATIMCNNVTRMTGSTGRAEFSLPYGDYTYEVSKASDYNPVSGEVSVFTEEQTINVGLSNKVFNIEITVFDSSGDPLSGATVRLDDGSSATTNSSGVARFTNKKNGSYPYTASCNGYQSASSTVSVSNADGRGSITLTMQTRSFTVQVWKDGYGERGTSISYKVYKSSSSSDVTNSGSGSTDDSGRYSFSGFTLGYVVIEVEDDDCLSRTSGRIAMSQGSWTVNIYRALILSFSSSGFSRPSGSYDYDLDGLKIKMVGGDRSNPSTLSFSCANNASLRSIDQWPTAFAINATSAFTNCTSLSSVASGSPTIVSNITNWFKGCTGLSTIPSQLFLNVQGSDASECFRGSGITTVPTNLFGSNLTKFFSVFRECSKLSTISGTPFNNGLDFESAFNSCKSLRTISSTTFSKCTRATTFYYVFARCESLSTVPSGLFSYSEWVTDCQGVFETCTNLQSIPNNLFSKISAYCSFATCCYGCTALRSIGTNAFPAANATSFSWSFTGCSALESIANFKQTYDRVKTFARAFEGTGISSVPKRFFEGHVSLTTISACFKNCLNLKEIEPDDSSGQVFSTFVRCAATDLSELFRGCTQLGATKYYYDSATKAQVIGFAEYSFSGSSINWNYAFNGCTSLVSLPCIRRSSVSGLTFNPIYFSSSYYYNKASLTGTDCFTNCPIQKDSNINPMPSSWL